MKVLVPGALRSYTGELHVRADGDTLAAMFADLDRRTRACVYWRTDS